MHLVTSQGSRFIDETPIDVVERKGIGHPDSLADGLAEAISREYSLYCLEHFGHVLHHNTDKTALLGGSSHVAFGKGVMTQPILALVNGRLSSALGSHEIPVMDIITNVTKTYLKSIMPLLDVEHDVLIQTRNSLASSPGQVHVKTNDQEGSRSRWFRPQSLADLREISRLFSNDTSCGVGYAPYSIAERVALSIEQHLNGVAFKAAAPEFGSDIKTMVCRSGHDLNITICVPQIANYTPDLDTYIQRKQQVQNLVCELAEKAAPGFRANVSINTRDDHERCELYLTAIGSSIESGDEGVVGRGNRPNGVISMLRPMSMEGASGKNPVYHIGKLYNILAMEAAQRIYQQTDRPTTVVLVSQSGRDLVDPWFAGVEQAGEGPVDNHAIKRILEEVLDSVAELRSKLLRGEQRLF